MVRGSFGVAFAATLFVASLHGARAASVPAPSDAMLMPVHRWIDAFNAAKTLPEDVFTDDVIITDQFPPYAWSGKAQAHAWSRRIEQGFHDPRVKHEHVVTEQPRAFMVTQTGDRATFVLAARLTYELDGSAATDRALWLFVVVRNADGTWRIAADTWTRTDG